MDEGLRVRDVMSTEVTTVERNEKLVEAERLMNVERIRHIPVVDDSGDLVGIISQRDLFYGALMRALGYGSRQRDQLLDQYVAKNAMTSDVQTTTPDTPLSDAAKLMKEKRIGSLVVVDGDRIAGILTEGDFVSLAIRD